MYPHIKKYLGAKTSIAPFKVTTHNMYGTILFLSLEPKPFEYEPPLEFGDFMQIRIPKWYVDKCGPYISNKKIDLFNETVQRMMLYELKVELDAANQKVGDIKRIINRFRERYGILDTELDYMNLRRHYHRQQMADKK